MKATYENNGLHKELDYQPNAACIACYAGLACISGAASYRHTGSAQFYEFIVYVKHDSPDSRVLYLTEGEVPAHHERCPALQAMMKRRDRRRGLGSMTYNTSNA